MTDASLRAKKTGKAENQTEVMSHEKSNDETGGAGILYRNTG